MTKSIEKNNGLGPTQEIDLTKCLKCGDDLQHILVKNEVWYLCGNKREECGLGIREEELKRCPTPDCKKPFVEVEDPITGTITGHLFAPDCEHFPKGKVLISIG